MTNDRTGFISIRWMNKESRNSVDPLPMKWFSSEGKNHFVEYEYVTAKGELIPIRCSVTVSGSMATLNYGGPHASFNKDIWIGETKLEFTNNARTVIKRVLWRDDGKRKFEELPVIINQQGSDFE